MDVKRFEYIDVAKGIGILTVVWAHILLVGWSHRLIYAFHMPLFFFISGILYNKDKYTAFVPFLKARFKRLIVPYLIYSIATWCIWAVFRYLQGGNVESYWMPLLQTFISQGSGAFMVHNSALWFIPCLFMVEVMYYFISKSKVVYALVMCLIIAVIGVCMAHFFGADYLNLLPWNLDAAFYGLLFYGVANCIKRHISHAEVMAFVEHNRLTIGGIVAVLFAVLWYLSMNYGECSMGSSSYQCPEYIFFIRAFVGCFMLIMASALLCSCRFVDWLKNPLIWCGANSLDIMCQHIPIKGIAIIGVTMLLHPSVDVSQVGSWSTLFFIVTMIACVLITCLINKYIRK